MNINKLSHFSSTCLFLGCGALLLACSGGGDAKQGAATPGAKVVPAAGSAPAPAAAPRAVQIKELGVELTAKVMGAPEKGIGSDYIVTLDDGTPMGTFITLTTELANKKFDDAVGKAEMYTATSGKIEKKEQTADGWVFRYNNTGELGANFFVDVVKTVGGKQIECTTMASSAAGAELAEAACRSIAAAK